LDTAKTIVAIGALPAAFLTFFIGYRQKEKERTLTYYHKVVTDVAVPNIFTFFADQIPFLTEAGRNAHTGIKSVRKTMPRSSSLALAEFSTKLFALRDSITDRTIVFDDSISNKIDLAFEKIQDDAAAWFNDVAQHKRRNLEDLTVMLRRGQRTVIGLLYRGQFKNL
jgi:hypothetical protein